MRPDDFVFFPGGLQYGNIEDVLKDRGELVSNLVSSYAIGSFSRWILHPFLPNLPCHWKVGPRRVIGVQVLVSAHKDTVTKERQPRPFLC
jgi:hypothetical protein